MKLLLDTRFAFWWQTGDRRITEEVRSVVEAADETFVSSVPLWEATIKAALGKIRIDLPAFAEQVESMGFAWLPIENTHILTRTVLPGFDDHRTPFDRLLVSRSMSEPLILPTADGKLGRYGSTVRVA